MSATQSIEKYDLMCPICLEVLQRPRLLPCNHAFCLLCIQKYANAANRKFKNFKKRLCCPACRSQTELPSEGATGFSRSDRLERSLEKVSFEQDGMPQSISSKCSLCQHERTEIAMCAHCKMKVCEYCGPSHANQVAQDGLVLREKLREFQKNIQTTAEDDEERMRVLEEEVKRAVEGRVHELHQRRDQLCQKILELKKQQKTRGYQLSEEVESLLSAYEEHQIKSMDWRATGELYKKMSHFVESDSASKTQGSLRLSLNLNKLQLHSESAADSHNVNSNTEEKSSRYRIKRSYSRNKWDRRICGRPAGIAISPWTNDLYVTSSDACKIFIYNSFGKQVGTIGSRGQEEGQFLCPVGIAFNEVTEELFVADKWKHCIYVFDLAGNYVRQIGKKGRGLAEFFSPEGLSTDSSGNLYIADTCNDRIQVLDSEGVFIKEIGSVKTENIGRVHQYTRREFKEPTGVSATKDGSIVYVADSGNHKIKAFDARTGSRLLSFGSKGNNQSQFESPECVVADEEGYFLVGDSGNGRVQVFQQDGTFIRYLGSKTTSEKGEFGWVSALAVNKEGIIAVADFKHNLIAFY